MRRFAQALPTGYAQRRSRRWLLPAGLLSLGMLAGLILLKLARHIRNASSFDHASRPANGQRVPLAPDPLLARLTLAVRLHHSREFLQQAWGPATTTGYAVQPIDHILGQLDEVARAAPGPVARVLARYTSLLKHVGIVGWADLDRQVVLEGWIDDHEPVICSDGMLTIDLRIVRLWIDDEEVTSRLRGQRHLRVEVFAPVVRTLNKIPQLHDCVRAVGLLRIDHDGLDFYEVHACTPGAIQVLDCAPLSFSREASAAQPRRQRLALKLWPFN